MSPIIHGIHPAAGRPYQMVNSAEPLVVEKVAAAQSIPAQFIGRADQGAVNDLAPYHFKLLSRSGMVCLWEKSRGGKGAARYEVVVLQVRHLTRFPDGSVSPAHEALPAPESWGVSAWSPATLEAAHERFNKLTRSR